MITYIVNKQRKNLKNGMNKIIKIKKLRVSKSYKHNKN